MSRKLECHKVRGRSNEPVLRSRFLDRLEELLAKEFAAEKLFPVLDRFESEISPEAALDRRRWPGGVRADLHTGIAQIKQYINDRRAFVRRELANLRQGVTLPNR